MLIIENDYDRVLVSMGNRAVTCDQLRSELGLAQGPMAGILSTLESQGRVYRTGRFGKSILGNPSALYRRGSGGHTRHNRKGTMPWAIVSMHQPILDALVASPGLNARGVARATGFMLHTVSPQLLWLVRNGRLLRERGERGLYCYWVIA